MYLLSLALRFCLSLLPAADRSARQAARSGKSTAGLAAVVGAWQRVLMARLGWLPMAPIPIQRDGRPARPADVDWFAARAAVDRRRYGG